MKALLYRGPGKGTIKDIPMPMCRQDEVIIQVKSCGICYHCEWGHETVGTSASRYPVVPGHEFAGIIHEVGERVTSIKVNDRVTADNTVACERCYYCKGGFPGYCNDFGVLGHNLNGGFAEYLVVRESKCFKIKDSTSFNAAALTEAVACCVHCIDRCGIRYGDVVVIFGAGPNGMILAQLAKESGASRVISIAGAQNKLDILNRMGIETIRMDREAYSVHENRLREMSPHGVDIVIDATASNTVINSAFKLLKKGGKLMQYSYMPDGEGARLTLNANLCALREITYLTTGFQANCFGRALQAIENGVVNVDVMITHEFPLENYFMALKLNHEDRSAIKVMIHP